MKLWRILLVWCLAAALPGQAFAMALSSACLRAHAQVSSVAPTAAPCHDAADADEDDNRNGPTQSHTCSACAACGPGAAWIPRLWTAPEPDRPQAWLSAVPAAVAQAIDPGQYKPPRRHSA